MNLMNIKIILIRNKMKKKKNKNFRRRKFITEKNIEAMTENNKILSNKINEIEFQFKDIEIKQQLEIIELKKKISLLEQENNNDKVIISELNKQINMKGKEIIKNNENQNNINIIINNDNNQRKINYLNKKFINYNYNFEHIQDKEKIITSLIAFPKIYQNSKVLLPCK